MQINHQERKITITGKTIVIVEANQYAWTHNFKNVIQKYSQQY